ncbi:unnamed protein product, partial [Coregonus sp. 'balchen']
APVSETDSFTLSTRFIFSDDAGACLPSCRLVYERGTNVEQFVTRFLLKESANQIQSLLNSVESAVDAIDEQHCSQSGVSAAKDVAPRNINTATGVVEVRKETLEAQINRLAELIGRLENKTVWFDLHQRLTDTDGTASA